MLLLLCRYLIIPESGNLSSKSFELPRFRQALVTGRESDKQLAGMGNEEELKLKGTFLPLYNMIGKRLNSKI